MSALETSHGQALTEGLLNNARSNPQLVGMLSPSPAPGAEDIHRSAIEAKLLDGSIDILREYVAMH